MNKEKLAKLKKKIKDNAPEIAVSALTIGSAVTISIILNKSLRAATSEGGSWTLPVITGEEKKAILERDDSILQKLEDDVYFLSFPPTDTED